VKLDMVKAKFIRIPSRKQDRGSKIDYLWRTPSLKPGERDVNAEKQQSKTSTRDKVDYGKRCENSLQTKKVSQLYCRVYFYYVVSFPMELDRQG